MLVDMLKILLRVIDLHGCEERYYYHLCNRKCGSCKYSIGNSCMYLGNKKDIKIC